MMCAMLVRLLRLPSESISITSLSSSLNKPLSNLIHSKPASPSGQPLRSFFYSVSCSLSTDSHESVFLLKVTNRSCVNVFDESEMQTYARTVLTFFMKPYFFVSFIIGLLALGGGCSAAEQTNTPITESFSTTAEVEVVSTTTKPEMIVTTRT